MLAFRVEAGSDENNAAVGNEAVPEIVTIADGSRQYSGAWL